MPVDHKTPVQDVDGTHVKRVILSIIADYDLKTGLCELVDNAIDQWSDRKYSGDLRLDLELDVSRQVISVRDNAGGVTKDDLHLLISPGRSRNDPTAELIGIFGVGEALRDLVTRMHEKLSDKSICNYIQIAKSIVASAVDRKGNQLHPRSWNNDFIRLPIVDEEKQNRPTVTAEEVSSIVGFEERYSVLNSLLAGSGLRIGEALAIRANVPSSKDYSYLSKDCRIIHVNRSVRRGIEQEPKTVNAIRVVDLAPSLTDVLKTYLDNQQRKSNLLFQSENGSFLFERNLLRDSLHPAAKELGRKFGFHVFRRFRASVLRANGVLEDLVKLWLGHANENVTDRYAKQLKQDVDLRQHWATKVGLGFQLPDLICATVQPETENVSEEVAA